MVYPLSKKCSIDSLNNSKFLWKSGWGEVLKSNVASGISNILESKRICLKGCIDERNSSFEMRSALTKSTSCGSMCNSFLLIDSIRLVIHWRSSIPTIVSGGSMSKSVAFFDWERVNSGMMDMLVSFSFESWVSTSKLRMVSTSLPKKSILKGYSLEKEKYV